MASFEMSMLLHIQCTFQPYFLLLDRYSPTNYEILIPKVHSIALYVEEDCVHHGESPMGGQKGLELRGIQAGHHHQPGGPHQQPSLQRPLSEGREEVRIETHHHHHRTPRLLTHLLTEDTLADSGNSVASL